MNTTMIPTLTTDSPNRTDRAVSPVIGVILMVAITVILAAVIGTFVLDLGQSAGDTAPSASLRVTADTGNDDVVIEHTGGDGLDAAQTRVTITNESNDQSATFEPAPSADVLSVGGEATFNFTSSTPATTSSGTWSGMTVGSEDWSAGGIASGFQYTVQIIDTESQRVIYETTLTA